MQLVEPQCLADVANRAARPIGDDGGRNGRALARVLVINVLDHLLAAIVLEIDVDVRRLITLLGNEPLDERLHPRGIDFGNSQAITNHRVRGRTPALTKNLLAAREIDDVVDGQEVMLVVELLD